MDPQTRIISVTVVGAQTGESATARLDVALLTELRRQGLNALTRARLKDVFREGRVRIRGRAAEASRELAPGTYEIELLGELDDLPATAGPAPEGEFLSVLYEDADLLVLDKLSGVPSAPQSPQETRTAVGSALAHDPGLSGLGRGGLEPGLLHRLDTGTSGCLAFARTQPAYDRLHAAWRDRSVRKIYRAIADRRPDSANAPLGQPLTLWMGHDERAAKRMRALAGSHDTRQIRGKPMATVTQLTRVTPLGSRFDLEVEIQTGVMHQIRCTLQSWGAPISGDPIYGGAPASRLWLHAWKLALPRANGSLLWIESPLPAGWPIEGDR